MRISLILAASANNIIGNNNELPWHLPADFSYFKQKTLHKNIVMGRNTWQSIGRLLPQRNNIILSRNRNLIVPAEACVVHSIEECLLLAKKLLPNEELMIIGGKEIYNLFLPLATKIYLTKVLANVDGNIYGPKITWHEWQLIHEEKNFVDDKHCYNYNFLVYQRILSETLYLKSCNLN